LHTHYTLSACEVACAVVKNRGRRKNPYIKKPMLKLDNQTYRVEGGIVRIPVQPRRFIKIPLRCGEYKRRFLEDPTLKRGSITMIASTVVIAFSKAAEVMRLLGIVGLDVNETSIDGATSNGEVFTNPTKAIYHQLQYSMIRSKIARNTNRDRRVKARLLSKYGRREKNRVRQDLHRISKAIVEKAKSEKLAIALEKLTNIRRGWVKGNGMGKNLRGRLNRWPFRELQRQIEYKAKWEATPIIYVDVKDTSTTCSTCGSKLEKLNGQGVELRCPECGVLINRHLNAAVNIMKRARSVLVWFAGHGPPSEGVVQPATVTRGRQGVEVGRHHSNLTHR